MNLIKEKKLGDGEQLLFATCAAQLDAGDVFNLGYLSGTM